MEDTEAMTGELYFFLLLKYNGHRSWTMSERRAYVPKIFDVELAPMPAPVMGQPLDRLTVGLVLAPVVFIIVAICAQVVVRALVTL